MEFRQIEAFINVAKYKSFSRAADATFLSQPTISAHINNLEQELGTLLINRTGREITLTMQGETLYPYAVNLLQTRTQALKCVQKQSEEISGVLDIYASSIPGQYYLPMLLRLFRNLYSNVRFYVEQSDSRQVIENILSQKGEIGFTGCKVNNSLVYEPIFEDEMVLLVPDDKRFKNFKNGSKVNLAAFIEEDFILREDGSGTRQEMEKIEIDGISAVKKMNIIARMNNMEAIKQAVANGLGVSMLSRRAVESSIDSYAVKYFKIDGLERRRIFYLVYNNKKTYLSPMAQAFRELAMQHSNISSN